MAEISRVCCFTGHRPENMGFSGSAEAAWAYRHLKSVLRKEIRAKIEDGVLIFITGCARGTDIICGEIVLEMRRKFPQVQLICALPFAGQEEKWSLFWKIRHAELLAHADEIVHVTNTPSRHAFLQRDRYMVDRSTDMIAVFNGLDEGGTAYTVRYAMKKHLSFVLIHPQTLNIVRREEDRQLNMDL